MLSKLVGLAEESAGGCLALAVVKGGEQTELFVVYKITRDTTDFPCEKVRSSFARLESANHLILTTFPSAIHLEEKWRRSGLLGFSKEVFGVECKRSFVGKQFDLDDHGRCYAAKFEPKDEADFDKYIEYGLSIGPKSIVYAVSDELPNLHLNNMHMHYDLCTEIKGLVFVEYEDGWKESSLFSLTPQGRTQSL